MLRRKERTHDPFHFGDHGRKKLALSKVQLFLKTGHIRSLRERIEYNE